MWHRFSQPLREVILRGLEEASRHDRSAALPEDFLAGMRRVPDCMAARVLGQNGSPVLPEAETPAPACACSVDAIQLFERAYEEAASLADRLIGSDHLLLAMLHGHSDLPPLAGLAYEPVHRRIRRLRRLGIAPDSPVHEVHPFDALLRQLRKKWRVLATVYNLYVRLSAAHPKVVTNPYPIYDRLRRKGVVRRDPLLPAWIITGYAEVAQVFRDTRFSSKARSTRTKSGTMEIEVLPAGPVRRQICVIANVLTRMMVFSDDPSHAQVRNRMGQMLSPRNVARLHEQVQLIADELLDQVLPAGQMDLIKDYTSPLPLLVVSDIMGFHRRDSRRLKEWSDAFSSMLSLQTTTAGDLQARRAMIDMRKYFDEIVAELRLAPNGTMLSQLISPRDGSTPMDLDELFGNCVFLLAAGHETTGSVLGSGMRALLLHPEQLQRLRDDPSLVPSAVEELLRFESPVQWTSRIATEAMELAGKQIAKGEMVLVSIGAANHDPRQFPEPHRLDVARANAAKNLAFSGGSHYCLGASLARIELQVGLSTLLRRVMNIRVVDGFEVTWRRGHTLRLFDALPIRFDPVRDAAVLVETEEALQPNSS